MLYFLLSYVLDVKQFLAFFSSEMVNVLAMGEKKVFSTRIDEDRIKGLKHLSVDTERSLGNLLEEAIQDLLRKYEYENKPKK